MADIKTVLEAINVFSGAPDRHILHTANAWLQDFQHSPEAWSTCNTLLFSDDAPEPAKLFAAQTFRTKVTYDLNQVDPANHMGLRDTLIRALEKHYAGRRAVIVQLCLAIAGLTLQLPSWENPVQDMIGKFGNDPASVPVLLQFLTILPEEINTNTRIPITDDEYREREAALLTRNARQVMDLLAIYFMAQGATPEIKNQIFLCLSSWLESGEVVAMSLVDSPLLPSAFEALESYELFDAAVSFVCNLIHETQEVEDNRPVIERIFTLAVGLRQKFAENQEDPDRIRGYTRIFAEAGETYRSLLLHQTEHYFPIVEAIAQCSAYHDLDVVPITFPFWMRLAQSIGKKPSVAPPFINAYKALMEVIIGHLRFPPDSSPLTGQEADDFRQFRHVMGDTLKDCCYVLGTDVCLLSTYQTITTALSQPNISWQEIEAPLFSMRSMGAEVDPLDEQAVPQIMDLIPQLPSHPRVRYAALLIISRYTEWINKHPAYIPFQLQYISKGFEDSDSEVNAAAGQALKYLCQDCRTHLVEFVPQLQTFVNTMGPKLIQDDKLQVYQAISFVISAMPMEQAAQFLRTFTFGILAQIHIATTEITNPTKEQNIQIANTLENLEVMLTIVETFGEDLPVACQNACGEAWAVFDPFLEKLGSDYRVCEHATRCLRVGLNFFGNTTIPLLPLVLSRMASCFQSTGQPGYIWIVGKIVSRFGNLEDPDVRSAYKSAYEQISAKMVLLLQEKTPPQIPDVIEDYVQMLIQMAKFAPDLLFPSSAFPVAFKAAVASLPLLQTEVVFAALEFICEVLLQDCLLPNPSPPPKFPIYAAAIQPVLQREGLELTTYVLSGMVGDFHEESSPMVIDILRSLARVLPAEFLVWLPKVLSTLPSSTVPDPSKAAFVSDVTRIINSQDYEKMKIAVLALHRASLKARDRRRNGPFDKTNYD